VRLTRGEAEALAAGEEAAGEATVAEVVERDVEAAVVEEEAGATARVRAVVVALAEVEEAEAAAAAEEAEEEVAAVTTRSRLTTTRRRTPGQEGLLTGLCPVGRVRSSDIPSTGRREDVRLPR
jgi:hypothetical protein